MRRGDMACKKSKWMDPCHVYLSRFYFVSWSVTTYELHFRNEPWVCVWVGVTRVSSSLSEPMRTPKSLKIAETQARFIAVDWESLGYNITRCHTFNVTICYHYHKTPNQSKADCLEMDPKAPRHVVGNLPPNTNVSLKMILTNPEGRKESDETVIQTEEDGTQRFPSLHTRKPEILICL